MLTPIIGCQIKLLEIGLKIENFKSKISIDQNK